MLFLRLVFSRYYTIFLSLLLVASMATPCLHGAYLFKEPENVLQDQGIDFENYDGAAPFWGTLSGFAELGALDGFDSIHECRVCGKRWPNADALTGHMNAHLNVDYSCGICKRRFSKARSLTAHIAKHATTIMYTCELCRWAFSAKGELTTHMQEHLQVQDNNAQDNNLVGHKRPKEKEKRYACERCEKRFSTPATLKSHLRTHSGERPHVCDLCGQGFGRKGILGAHMRTHTGEKLYECAVCNKRYSRSSGLAKHKRVHEKAAQENVDPQVRVRD
jgi:hypothetical protein